MSINNLKVASSLELNTTTASAILVMGYESLRQILEAICISNGYKVYSHEAYTAYLKKIKEDAISEKFDRLRKLRNGCNYYGKPVSVQIAQNAKYKIKELCKFLKDKYLT